MALLKEWMRRIAVIVAAIFVFSILWPNLVHEPAHLLALKLQGLDGRITFDWIPPIGPSITNPGFQSMAGGLFFLMLPHLISLLVLAIIWRSRASAGLLTHLVPAFWITVDTANNIMGFRNPQDDFHFLVALPSFVWMFLFMMVCVTGIYVFMKSMDSAWGETDAVR